jgi:hypothetical protein
VETATPAMLGVVSGNNDEMFEELTVLTRFNAM